MYVSRIKIMLGFVALALVPMHSVSAQGESVVAERWLIAKYDMNGDQEISVDEVSAKREKLFGYMDGDADGEVSFQEYQELDISKRQLLLQARFAKLDLNHDGRLNAAEYSSYLGSFDSFDQNGDGYISPDEMTRPLPTDASADDAFCLLWLCVRSSIH